MGLVFTKRQLTAAALAGVTAITLAASRAPGQSAEELRHDLNAMKEQLEQLQIKMSQQEEERKKEAAKMQERLKKQEELINKLSAQKAPPAEAPVPIAASAATPAPTAVIAAAPVAPAAAPQEPWSPVAPMRLFGVGGAYMNVSFDVLLDVGWSTQQDVPLIETGDHDPKVRGFTLPNAEVVFDGGVDPYFKGVGNIVWKLDQNGDTNVELEEAYLLTTALPWNLQLKAGQEFVEFGRFNPQHPHQWEFVDSNLINDRMFGPEGLRSVGARLSWLTPTPFYSELMLSVLNSEGESAFSYRNFEPLYGRPPVDRPVSSLAELLWVPRYVAAFDLTDSQTLVTGVSGAFGPNASGSNTNTAIYGVDVFWKWKPEWQSGGFPFVAFQSEGMARRYEAGATADDTQGMPLPFENLYDWGFYSQVMYGFTQRWVAGLRGEWVSGDAAAFHPDPNREWRIRFSPDVTFYPTEFSKVRLQYNFDRAQITGDDSSVWLQLEFLLGSHGAHKF
jgi:hypothetical protein